MNKIFVFGEWWSLPEDGWTTAFANKICDLADQKKLAIANHSLSDIRRLLKELSNRWNNPDYPPRKTAQEFLPKLSGFHPKMISKALDHFSKLLDPELLQAKTKQELMGIPRDQDFHFDYQKNSFLHWHPVGHVLHVLSGNVFLVGPGSFLEGVLTGNITLLKLSSEETFFMPLFIESLVKVESDLKLPTTVSESLATVTYSSRDQQVIDTFKRRMDAFVIWGGEDAVRAYRNNLPARSRAIVFGPKISLALITSQGLETQGLEGAGEKLCEEMIIWDQNACTAPQVCFVEGKENAHKVAKALAKNLTNAKIELPASELEPNRAAEIRKLRTVAEISEATGDGFLYGDPGNLDWTVIVANKVEIEPSPLHRTIKIVPVSSWKDLLGPIEELRSYVQTVGVISTPIEQSEISQSFGRRGVLRVMALGMMNGGHVDDPHDGAYDLPQLMNLVVTRLQQVPQGLRAFELLPKDRQANIINERLKATLDNALNCPLYQDQTHAADRSLKNWPIINREILESNMPPKSKGLNSGKEIQGGHVTRSGGSTGDAKNSWFPKKDWQDMIENGCEVFRACGIQSSDRIANFFSAGDMYGSFLSVNGINEKIGATSFPFAATENLKEVVRVCKEFNINVVQGIPSFLINNLRKIAEIDPTLKFEKLIYAGENLSSSDKTWLQTKFGINNISSIIGTTECGVLGYQPNHDLESLYNTVDEYNLIELIDDQGLVVEDDQIGQIAVTSLKKQSFPVVRYLIGDQGRWVQRDEQRFLEYLGRGDNILAIGKMNLCYRDLETALKEYNISALQIVGSRGQLRDLLEINIESHSYKNEKLVEKIKQQLLDQLSALRYSIDKKNLDLQLTIKDIGSLPRNARTGKLRSIIDLRYS